MACIIYILQGKTCYYGDKALLTLGLPVQSDGEVTQLKSPASGTSPELVGSKCARSWVKKEQIQEHIQEQTLPRLRGNIGVPQPWFPVHHVRIVQGTVTDVQRPDVLHRLRMAEWFLCQC